MESWCKGRTKKAALALLASVRTRLLELRAIDTNLNILTPEDAPFSVLTGLRPTESEPTPASLRSLEIFTLHPSKGISPLAAAKPAAYGKSLHQTLRTLPALVHLSIPDDGSRCRPDHRIGRSCPGLLFYDPQTSDNIIGRCDCNRPHPHLVSLAIDFWDALRDLHNDFGKPGSAGHEVELDDLGFWDQLVEAISDVARDYGVRNILSQTEHGPALPKLRAFRLTALSFTPALSKRHITLHDGQICVASLDGLDAFCAKLMDVMDENGMLEGMEDCHGRMWEAGMKVWWAYV